jgi:hypothetical protein
MPDAQVGVHFRHQGLPPLDNLRMLCGDVDPLADVGLEIVEPGGEGP